MKLYKRPKIWDIVESYDSPRQKVIKVTKREFDRYFRSLPKELQKSYKTYCFPMVRYRGKVRDCMSYRGKPVIIYEANK